MNVGYCSVQDGDPKAKIAWDVLNSFPVETETKYFKHIHLPKPLVVRMDGRQRLIVASIE